MKLCGVYWTFSGKTECLNSADGLESYKLTLNPTLATSIAIASRCLQETADTVLTEIQRISPFVRNDFILQRYIHDIGSVYGGFTVTDGDEPSLLDTENAVWENTSGQVPGMHDSNSGSSDNRQDTIETSDQA
jgi:hypothetical protein